MSASKRILKVWPALGQGGARAHPQSLSFPPYPTFMPGPGPLQISLTLKQLHGVGLCFMDKDTEAEAFSKEHHQEV